MPCFQAGEVNRMAGILKGLGVGRGDRVLIYMPMVPEAAFAMLACARIGAIHSVVFGGFGEPTLHPHLPGMVGELKRQGLRVELISNGTLLADLRADRDASDPGSTKRAIVAGV